MLFKDGDAQQPFARDTEAFYNPKIANVEVTIEEVPNQLFSQEVRVYVGRGKEGLRTRQQTASRSGRGHERPRPGRRIYCRVHD